jgi:hypothetical protein
MGDVFLIDLVQNNIRPIRWGEFQDVGPFGKAYPPEFLDHYPQIRPAGKTSHLEMVYPFRDGQNEWVMVLSSDSHTVSKWDFGLPSPMPALGGRRKFIESVNYHSGVVFLEIFDVGRLSEPATRLTKKFETWPALPRLREFASWARGAERPVLVVIDRQTVSPVDRIIVKELPEQ